MEVEDTDLDAGRELHLCLGLMLQPEAAEHGTAPLGAGLGLVCL